MRLNPFSKPKQIYMDYAATTPTRSEVVAAMKPYWQDTFANPSSIHALGNIALAALQDFRKRTAACAGVKEDEVIFTSGGTEGNNLALLGLAQTDGSFRGVHIVTSKLEHPSVLEVLAEIQRRGGEVTYVETDEFGRWQDLSLRAALGPQTKAVIYSLVQGEIGTIQSAAMIKKEVEAAGERNNNKPYIIVDACQAPCYEHIFLHTLGADMLVIDGAKIYGPKGVGVLFKKHTVELRSIMFGGGQQYGLRSGSEALALIAGMTVALELAARDRENETSRLAAICDKAVGMIQTEFPESLLNGHPHQRVANNINICFPGIDAEYATIALSQKGIECSYASACATRKEGGSHVLEALGTRDCANSSLRFTLGRDNTLADIKRLIIALRDVLPLTKRQS